MIILEKKLINKRHVHRFVFYSIRSIEKKKKERQEYVKDENIKSDEI
jgi:hypothetical protein